MLSRLYGSCPFVTVSIFPDISDDAIRCGIFDRRSLGDVRQGIAGMQGKIKSLEQIFLFSLPVKEYQIVESFLQSSLKDEVMKIMPVQKQTRAGQRTRFKVRAFLIKETHGVPEAEHPALGQIACSMSTWLHSRRLAWLPEGGCHAC